jgi:hypothetical protein
MNKIKTVNKIFIPINFSIIITIISQLKTIKHQDGHRFIHPNKNK